MTENGKQTSTEIASHAAEVLGDSESTTAGRELAGSALDQTRPHDGGVNPDQTGERLASLASNVLRDSQSTGSERALAASVLAQSGPRD